MPTLIDVTKKYVSSCSPDQNFCNPNDCNPKDNCNPNECNPCQPDWDEDF